MKAFFLPQLTDDHKTPKPSGTGWGLGGSNRVLETISDDLNIHGDEIDEEIIHAIPTIFARSWLFGQSLFDPDSPLHDLVKEEWRGLMGIYCFRHFTGFRIQSRTVEIPSPEQARPEEKTFLQIMNAHLPQPHDLWRKITLIEIDDELVGATSPISIFFTPASYRCPKAVPWQKKSNGKIRFSDPTRYFEKSERIEDLRRLYFWINQVKDEARKTLEESAIRGKMNRLLEEWAAEIKNKFLRWDIPLQVEEEQVSYELDEAGIRQSPYLVFTKALKWKRSIQSTQRISDIQLIPTRSIDSPPLIICQETLQSEYMVFDSNYGDEIEFPAGNSGEILESRSGKQIRHRWLNPYESFFTDQILQINLNEETTLNPSFIKLEESTYTLPLTKAYFHYFHPDDLEKQSFKIHKDDEDTIHVSLKLPLIGTTIEITKEYRKEQIRKLVNIPILEVWPNFRTADAEGNNNWKLYYLYYSFWGQKQFTRYDFLPVIPGHEHESAADPERKLWRIDRFPDVIECQTKDEAGRIQPAGVLLLKLPQLIPIDTNRWKVGIDLGTSNTNIFYISLESDGQAQKLTIQDRCVQITSPEATTRQLDLLTHFFPPSTERRTQITPDFPTLLLKLSNPAGSQEALSHGIAYFPPAIEISNRVKSNIKWSSESRQLIPIYLEHLLIMIAAEAKVQGVEELEIRWSYPSSFGNRFITDLNACWNYIGGHLPTGNALRVRLSQGITESISVCRFCVNEQSATPASDQPTVCIDIGGGTTDIAIWLMDQMLAQTSLKLGGNDVIGRYAQQTPAFIQRLYEVLHQGKLTSEEVVNLFQNHPNAVLNILLHDEEKHEQLKYQLFGQQKCGEDIFLQARWLVYTFLSGLLYHVGSMLDATDNRLRDSFSHNGDVENQGKLFNQVTIFFAGKGSRLLDWPQEFSGYRHCLEKMVQQGYGSELNVLLNPAKNPKEETGRGLVYDYDFSYLSEPSSIAGEEGYTIDGKSLPAMELLEPEWYTRLSPPKQFKRFEDFIASVNESWPYVESIEKTKLTVELPPNMRDRFQQAKSNFEKESEGAVQSLFTIQLKILLDSMIQSGT